MEMNPGMRMFLTDQRSRAMGSSPTNAARCSWPRGVPTSWLAAEVINPEDHRLDTVSKKALYEDIHVPRLWMVDPRYHNVEVYHVGDYGLALKTILAGQEPLEDGLLPLLRVTMTELFAG